MLYVSKLLVNIETPSDQSYTKYIKFVCYCLWDGNHTFASIYGLARKHINKSQELL